ncbi:MAG TPA: hypothetical protein VLD67_21945 [Vicinamibacterales bacterium]|nr:hypothetical protein [Vicinamibacterales bacterium]
MYLPRDPRWRRATRGSDRGRVGRQGAAAPDRCRQAAHSVARSQFDAEHEIHDDVDRVGIPEQARRHRFQHFGVGRERAERVGQGFRARPEPREGRIERPARASLPPARRQPPLKRIQLVHQARRVETHPHIIAGRAGRERTAEVFSRRNRLGDPRSVP